MKARLTSLLLAFVLASSADALTLWSQLGATLVHDSGDGSDILGGAVERDDTFTGTLYFKFHIDPLSDVSTEEYYAGFQLYEREEPRLAIGNSPAAWAYSAFYTAETGESNKITGDFDLHSSRPESPTSGVYKLYEVPRRGIEATIIFKVQYVPQGDDLVTVWLNPDLGRGATEAGQLESLTTMFKANASFNQIRLRHVGRGGGWTFSDMAIATSFEDFVARSNIAQTWLIIGVVTLGLMVSVGGAARFIEKKKVQQHLRVMEQERALARERERIAQDLHDDLGSSLTRIALLSDLARADKNNAAQVEIHAAEISQSAAKSVRALEEIVWAVRPGSDSLQSLVEYIAHFSNELFAVGDTRCRLDLPHDLPSRPLPPEVRHNIFLIVKEALTNAMKHARAKEVHVSVKAAADSLQIIVRDDGEGAAPSGFSGNGHRHGVDNMQRRAAAMGGKLDLQSERGKGTTVTLEVNFANCETVGKARS